jgi:hypothetical protein
MFWAQAEKEKRNAAKSTASKRRCFLIILDLVLEAPALVFSINCSAF